MNIKDIYIFYHCYFDQKDNWLKIFNKTFNCIKTSGLNDVCKEIYINCAGNTIDKNLNIVKNFSNNVYIAVNGNDEIETINMLWEKSKEVTNSAMLYLHTKGVTHDPNNPRILSWTNLMEYFNIIKWKDCIEKLDTFDTCGVNLKYSPVPGMIHDTPQHYHGNFWWANSEYVKKLNKVEYGDRMNAEFWIANNEFCNPSSLHNSLLDHYQSDYPDYIYKNHAHNSLQ